MNNIPLYTLLIPNIILLILWIVLQLVNPRPVMIIITIVVLLIDIQVISSYINH